MKIRISEGFCLRLPTGLLLNGVTAPLVAKALREQNIHLSAKDVRQLLRSVRKYKKEHPDWVLAEVCGTNGKQVVIQL